MGPWERRSIYKSAIFGFHGCLFSRDYTRVTSSPPTILPHWGSQTLRLIPTQQHQWLGPAGVGVLIWLATRITPWKTNIRGTQKFMICRCFFSLPSSPIFHFQVEHICFQGVFFAMFPQFLECSGQITIIPKLELRTLCGFPYSPPFKVTHRRSWSEGVINNLPSTFGSTKITPGRWSKKRSGEKNTPLPQQKEGSKKKTDIMK